MMVLSESVLSIVIGMAANTSTSVTAHGAKTATLTFEIKNFAEVLAARGRGEGLTSDTVALGGGHFSCSVFPSGDSRCHLAWPSSSPARPVRWKVL